MGRLTRIALAGIVTLTMVGCGTGGEEEATAPPTPAVVQPVPEKPTAATPFTNPPVVTQSPVATLPVPATPNLIQPTNPRERVVVVRKGRSDPFAQIPGQSFPTAPTAAVPQRAVPTVPNLPTVARRQQPGARGQTSAQNAARGRSATTTRVAPNPNRTAGARNQQRNQQLRNQQLRNQQLRNQQRNQGANATANNRNRVTTPPKPIAVAPRQLPPIIPNPALEPVLPPPPIPELAQAVAVTGVIQVGNETQAIIKVPDEPTSRYVRAGQRLANGVLVKRIEMYEGTEPVVVLEQYGIEVARAVGEAPVTTTQPGTGNTNTVSASPASQNSAYWGA